MGMTTFLLSNGLRVLLDDSASSDVVYAGVAIASGTRHELDSESGMAHLVEHMTFKGTTTRTSRQISNYLESVGGELNAYTSKEETIYYAAFDRQHLRRALTLLLDITFCSTHPQHELEHEREVVIDEIESYHDSPAELIYDDFEALLFPDHPLGRNILGDAERLRQYTSSDLLAFTSRCYHPSRALLFIKGRVKEAEVKRMMKGLDGADGLNGSNGSNGQCGPLEPLEPLKPIQPIKPIEPIILSRSTHQSHVMLGALGYSMTDPRYVGLALLMNLLGGPAMNTRLGQALRERTGLVYAVEATATAYTDTGLWTIYFGCDHEDVKRCLRLVHHELHRLTTAPLSPKTLAAIKRQMCGQLAIAAENTENTTLAMAKQYLLTGIIRSLSQRQQEINAITPDFLHQIALETLQPTSITTLIYQ